MIPLIRINQSSIFYLRMLLMYIFRAYILSLQVYLSRVYCLCFKPTSSLRESSLVESLIYFSSLQPLFARNIFYSSKTKLDAGSQACSHTGRQKDRQIDRQRHSHLFTDQQTPVVPIIIFKKRNVRKYTGMCVCTLIKMKYVLY